MNENDFSRLELSLPNCRSNYRYFRSRLKKTTKLLVLVKANAYGHGAVEFASMLQAEGADYLAVALPVEGVELRRNGISLPVLVLTAGMDFFPEIIEYRLEPGIPNLETLGAFCDTLREKGVKDYPVHIKLDTGMHRLGFMPSEIDALTGFLKEHDEVRVRSIYSHLAAADELARQLRLRDLGGIIVVDFIDMLKAENRQALYERMKANMANDRARHNILQLSKFGLMLCNGGVWEGRRIISEEYVRLATSAQIAVREGGYGYFFWQLRQGGFRLSGKWGQKCFCFPKRGLVITYLANMEEGSDAGWQSMERNLL